MNYKLQKIGAGLLGLALVLLFFKETIFYYICYAVLIGVLGIDLYLVKKDEKTITQWYRPKLPPLVDKILTFVLIGVCIYLEFPVGGLFFLMGTINGHLNGDF